MLLELKSVLQEEPPWLTLKGLPGLQLYSLLLLIRRGKIGGGGGEGVRGSEPLARKVVSGNEYNSMNICIFGSLAVPKNWKEL